MTRLREVELDGDDGPVDQVEGLEVRNLLVGEPEVDGLFQQHKEVFSVKETEQAIAAKAADRLRGAFAEAESELLRAEKTAAQTSSNRRRSIVEELIALYDEWHTVSPDSGHAARAAEWRAKLAAMESK